MKTVERAHTPRNLWERVRLSRNFTKAVTQLQEHLAYWPEYLQRMAKKRLAAIHRVLVRMRSLKLNASSVPLSRSLSPLSRSSPLGALTCALLSADKLI